MAIMIPGVLLQAGLPAVSEVVSPEGLMVASIAVALLGVAVMMLTRPRTEMAGATESAAGEENPAQVEMPVVETAPPQPPFANVTLAEAARAQLAMKSETVPAEIPRPAAPAPVETAPVAAPAATSHAAPLPTTIRRNKAGGAGQSKCPANWPRAAHLGRGARVLPAKRSRGARAVA